MAKLTPAEKQKRYRERQKVTGNAPKVTVTQDGNAQDMNGAPVPFMTSAVETKVQMEHDAPSITENPLLQDLPMVATADKTIKHKPISTTDPCDIYPTTAEDRARFRRETGHPVGIVDAKGGPYVLPLLPDDDVCGCNSDIGWSDILAMPRERIDLAYKTWKAIGNDVSFLLRLMRSAGYYRRVG